MANDYLKTSEFGKVATSLLGKEKKSQNLDFVYSLVGGYLKGKQRQLKNGLNKAYKDLELEYSSIFTNNEAKYNLAKEERADYQSYLKDPEEFKRLKAIDLFNRDPSVLASGKNYSQISTLDETSRAAALELYNRYQKEAEEDIKRLGKSPEVSMATYEMYNKAAMDSYKAKFEALSNDPAKQSLLNAAFAKIFPGMFAKERVQYETAVENAEADKKAQEKLSLSYIKPLEEKEKEENEADIEVLNNAAQEVGMPVFYTSAERLKLDKDTLRKRMNQDGYKLTIEDLNKAGELGVQIPGLTGFNKVLISDRPVLISAFVKAQDAMSRNENPLDILQGREREVYALAMDTTAIAYDTRRMDFERAEIELERAKNPQVKVFRTHAALDAELENPEYQKRVENTIKDVVLEGVNKELLPSYYENFGDLLDNDIVTLSGTNAKDSFIQAVGRTAQELQQTNRRFQSREGIAESVKAATKIQLNGLRHTQKQGPILPGFLTQGREFTFYPVDSQWYKLIAQEELTQAEADYLKYGLNNYVYGQNLVVYGTDENGNPSSFSTGPYNFYWTNQKNNNKNITGTWDYEIIEE